MTDKDLSNVIQLFPNLTDKAYLTDEEYENELIPAVIRGLEILGDDCRSGSYELLNKTSESLIRYARRSLITLDSLRRGGTFDNGQLPPITAFDVDNFAADNVIAILGDIKLAEKLRNRSEVKRRD